MVKLDKFEIVFNNPEEAYFAGQEVSGKVVIETSAEKKVNEILLELKGCAKTYWTKHSGKSRAHFSSSEPYFCEQFNTHFTHRFAVPNPDGSKSRERVLPAGVHEVPFSYTLPKSLPSSFEGDFGNVRYSCRAICERPWDFDIVTKKYFTVLGIVDNNEDPRVLQPASASGENYDVKFCCRRQGCVSVDLEAARTGYTPGEQIRVNAKISNQSRRNIKNSTLRLCQQVNYKAKTFAGSEKVKSVRKVIQQKEKGEIASQSEFRWTDETLTIPALPPQLCRCQIIEVSYTLEMEASGVLVKIPISIGTIPLLSDILKKLVPNGTSPQSETIDSDGDHVRVPLCTVTDESGRVVAEPSKEELASEKEALIAGKKRVRMPSSILSELYPSLPSPYYRESHFGQVDVSGDKDCTYGDTKFAPKYPFYVE